MNRVVQFLRNRKKQPRQFLIALLLISVLAAIALPWRRVDLVKDGTLLQIWTKASTLQEFLTKHDIAVSPADLVFPSMKSSLHFGSKIEIKSPVPYTLTVDDVLFSGKSQAQTVREVLEERAIPIAADDHCYPNIDTVLYPGIKISVLLAAEEIKTFSESIPMQIETQYLPDYPAGMTYSVTKGQPGEIETIVTKKWLGNTLMESTQEKRTVSEMIPEIRLVGSQKQIMLPEGAPLQFSYSAEMTTSGYCSCYACCGKNPGDYGYGITASGLPQGYGVVGVDPRAIPFGTRMYIPGYGYAVAGDTGGAIFSTHLDLGFGTHAEASAWALQRKIVYFLD